MSDGEPTPQQIFDAITERNALLDRISSVLTENTRELQRTQVLLDHRPPGSELDFKRRRLLVGLLALIVLTIWAHDQHVEQCGPGARAEHAVEAQLRGEDRREIETVVRGVGTPKLCDVTFPLHDHDDSGWPAAFNVLGVVAYLGLFVGLCGWLLVGYQRMEEDRRKEVAATTRNTAARTRVDDLSMRGALSPRLACKRVPFPLWTTKRWSRAARTAARTRQ